MKCIRCQNKEMKYIKRGLCDTCYAYVYRLGELDNYPNDHNRWAVSKYSPEMLSAMQELIVHNETPLREIGEKFGCSRENIRQKFEKVYGFHYTVIKNKRIHVLKEKKERARQLKKDPRNKILRYENKNCSVAKGVKAEKRVLEIGMALGYKINPYIDGQRIDLVINGYNVEVKSAYKSIVIDGAKTPIFHFSFHKNQREISDFVICWAAPINAFFIIPNEFYPKGNSIYIPEKPVMEWITGRNHNVQQRRISKWYSYLEAWHLLKPESKEIVFNRLLAADAANDSSKSNPEELISINAGRGNMNPLNANLAPIMQRT